MSDQTNPTSIMEVFFTRERANAGIKLPLTQPDGTETDYFIRIRGVDSDAFKAAEAEAKRNALELAAIKDRDKLQVAIFDQKRAMLAALVIDWNLPLPCNPENILKLLREAPQIADEIDRLAAKRHLFFAVSSTPSTPSPAPSSS